MRSRVDIWGSVCLVVVLGCGGPAAAESPATAKVDRSTASESNAPAPEPADTAEQRASSADPAPVESPPASSGEPPPGGSTDAPPSSEQAVTQSQEAGRKPADLLTAPTVAFMINYNASAPKEAAERTCREEEPDDLQARAACIQKARADFVADVLVFKKEGQRWAWIIYRRDRSALLEVSTTQVEFGDETANTIVVRTKGDRGRRPLFFGMKEVQVRVPTSSTIELDDPKYGRLVYEAKVGLVGSD